MAAIVSVERKHLRKPAWRGNRKSKRIRRNMGDAKCRLSPTALAVFTDAHDSSSAGRYSWPSRCPWPRR